MGTAATMALASTGPTHGNAILGAALQVVFGGALVFGAGVLIGTREAANRHDQRLCFDMKQSRLHPWSVGSRCQLEESAVLFENEPLASGKLIICFAHRMSG